MRATRETLTGTDPRQQADEARCSALLRPPESVISITPPACLSAMPAPVLSAAIAAWRRCRPLPQLARDPFPTPRNPAAGATTAPTLVSRAAPWLRPHPVDFNATVTVNAALSSTSPTLISTTRLTPHREVTPPRAHRVLHRRSPASSHRHHPRYRQHRRSFAPPRASRPRPRLRPLIRGPPGRHTQDRRESDHPRRPTTALPPPPSPLPSPPPLHLSRDAPSAPPPPRTRGLAAHQLPRRPQASVYSPRPLARPRSHPDFVLFDATAHEHLPLPTGRDPRPQPQPQPQPRHRQHHRIIAARSAPGSSSVVPTPCRRWRTRGAIRRLPRYPSVRRKCS